MSPRITGMTCPNHEVGWYEVMRWTIAELTVGWPPSIRIVRAPGDDEALNPLFLRLGDKRLLLFGYGPTAGITTLDDLAQRIDAIREELFQALAALRPRAPIAVWLNKLQGACQELLTKTYDAINASGAKPSAADIIPAVDELRDAFLIVAQHVAQEYDLPAARTMALTIQGNRAAGEAS
jgi:hypothetical protein